MFSTKYREYSGCPMADHVRPNYYLELSLRIQLYIRVLLVVNFCQSRIVQN